jgi:excisionase family DNA binding protein
MDKSLNMGYLNLSEVASYLKMSKSTIYKWCSDGKIPYIKTGKVLLFKKDTIDSWLEQYNVPTKVEVGQNISNLLKQSSSRNYLH